MAAGPATQIADIIVPEIFTPYTQILTEEKSRLVQSGLLARSAELDDLLAGGGLTFNMPRFDDLDNDAERISSDASVPFASAGVDLGNLPAGQQFPPDPNKIGTLQEIATRLNRNNSWSNTNLTTVLAGADPMNAIAQRVAAYWTRRLQLAFIATWNGVIADNVTNDAGDYENDISGGAFIDGVTNFSAEAFLDTAQTMGDSQDSLAAAFVHSVVYNRMRKNNLIDFIPDARGEVSIPTFLGHEVIIDDGLPRTGSIYDTWLFGQNATQFGVGTPNLATELDRKPGGGNGGGQDVLYSRVEWSIHPTGHAFQGTPVAGGPSNTGTGGNDLDEAVTWDRVYPERKQINFARLVSREA
tara:strand:+ start:712 stop:1779 length:1068 start_codon:yes stop_codon:yes gene_type:complete